MPTIMRHGAFGFRPIRIRAPTAPPRGKNRLASAWLTTATFRESGVSLSARLRPSSTGMRSVLK